MTSEQAISIHLATDFLFALGFGMWTGHPGGFIFGWLFSMGMRSWLHSILQIFRRP